MFDSILFVVFEGFLALVVSRVGGEFLTEKLLDYVENDLKVEVVPDFYLERVIREDGSYNINRIPRDNVTNSLLKFGKMNAMRTIKE
jgi:hypothetical protein